MTTVNLTTSMSSCLSALKTIDATMEDTNQKLATGLKVNSALDDPLSYFASQDHLDQADTLSLLNDDMNEAIQTINAADSGIESIKSLLDDAKALCNSALSSDDDDEIDGYMGQINDILDDIDELAEDSGYAGVNLLSSDTLDVVFNESGDSSITLTGIDGSAAGLCSGLAAQSGWDSTSATTINSFLDAIKDAKTELRSSSKELSSQLSVITTRQEFTAGMVDVLEAGSANLINADLNQESANLLALQTQQALATNSLSISSQSMQSVLNLF
jgi:flagellin